MRSPLDLSVVIPAHNESDALPAIHQELHEVLDATGLEYEIIFVDDGSDDGSFEWLEGLRRADARVRVIRLRRNYGQTAALDAGFRLARGERIASMDADGENDPRDLPALLARLDGDREDGADRGRMYDVVCGWRRSRHDPALSRRIPSRLANKLIALWTGVPVRDCGCTLRVYRAPVVRSLALYAEMHRLLPAIAHLGGARIAEAPVAHRARRGGRSHYGISRAWKVLIDLCAVLLVARVAARPVRWLSAIALPFLALGALAIAAAARDAGLWGSADPRAAGAGSGPPIVAVACAMLFLFLALYLALAGVLGEALLEGNEAELRRDVERLA
jgi:glycosyltransferase involved in cell wall biosynthesis